MDRGRCSANRGAKLLSAFVLSASLAACSPPSPDILGITLGSDGRPEIVLAPCVGEPIIRIKVWDLQTDDTHLPHEKWDDFVIWEIESGDGAMLDGARLGVVPPGFREVTPYRQAPLRLPQAELMVTVTRAHGQGGNPSMVFDPRDLRAGLVLFPEGGRELLRSPSEFRRQAAEDCE